LRTGCPARPRISIVRDLNQEVAYVGDEASLHELFLIFLDNAIKYSPSDSQVRVNLTQNGSSIRICFEDEGGNRERAFAFHF